MLHWPSHLRCARSRSALLSLLPEALPDWEFPMAWQRTQVIELSNKCSPLNQAQYKHYRCDAQEQSGQRDTKVGVRVDL